MSNEKENFELLLSQLKRGSEENGLPTIFYAKIICLALYVIIKLLLVQNG